MVNEWATVKTLRGPARQRCCPQAGGRGEVRPFPRAPGLGQWRQMLYTAPPNPIWGFQLDLGKEWRVGVPGQWVPEPW